MDSEPYCHQGERIYGQSSPPCDPKSKNQHISPSPASDLFVSIKSHILSKWTTQWNQQTNNKLKTVKPTPQYWPSSDRSSRREETVLTRLRIGHSRLTHTHLISHLFLPECQYCSEENLTVDYLFSCPELLLLRQKHNIPDSRKHALCNSSDTISEP